MENRICIFVCINRKRKARWWFTKAEVRHCSFQPWNRARGRWSHVNTLLHIPRRDFACWRNSESWVNQFKKRDANTAHWL